MTHAFAPVIRDPLVDESLNRSGVDGAAMLYISGATSFFISNALYLSLTRSFCLLCFQSLCFNRFLLFTLCLFAGFIRQFCGSLKSFTCFPLCTFCCCASLRFPASCSVQFCLMLGFRVALSLLCGFTL
ncbi:Uncharacterised protein [Kluyvera cryocrescens]|uniref:Transmembrane protein n=1 Tax=Kluyvera cryocrescens TaxID=580 RepID=A0A485ATU1_KLUCR|nr:Uncharacterised protein [Kluyvera cryocrescens]